jgi:hypothetical protein
MLERSSPEFIFKRNFMYFPFFLFILDVLLWYSLPRVQEIFNISALTDVVFLLAFGVFLVGISEVKELVDGIVTVEVIEDELGGL